ncbi:hypothetical protein DFH09DRAFT_1128132, partial [Mycena vulgaris]
SGATGLDALKVHPINGSAFDWWYFDAVFTDPAVLSSDVVTFFASSQPAFPLLDPSDSITMARICQWVSFPNGTLWSAVSNGDGATWTWHGTGFSWVGTPASEYLIAIDAPEVAPAHYPCGPAEGGQTMEVGPNIGWANAVPDAASIVNLKIGDTRLAFKGTGYHDKNWSSQPFTTHVASWYWGHGRIGNFSIVWFDLLDLTGKESVSACASKDDEIIAASCTLSSIKVRPTGQNATYPPVISMPNPTGYHIDLDLGVHGQLEVAPLIGLNPEYAHSVGTMSGFLVPVRGHAATGLTGMALFEQFKLMR